MTEWLIELIGDAAEIDGEVDWDVHQNHSGQKAILKRKSVRMGWEYKQCQGCEFTRVGILWNGKAGGRMGAFGLTPTPLQG
ncbi:MAG: hypothetical protein U0694_06345 [Anaerolineae bacterium]